MAAIRNIIFDLGNVLVSFDWQIAYQRLAQHVSPMTALLLWARKEEFLREVRGDQELMETGRMTAEQFYVRIKGKIGLTLDYPQFETIWCDIFTANAEVLALARMLGKNYSCYIFSNTNAVHMKHLRTRVPELALFKGMALSHELGVMKPAREFFELALRALELEAAESVFVDDLAENVAGARECGIDSIQYQSCPHLVQELAARGVACSAS